LKSNDFLVLQGIQIPSFVLMGATMDVRVCLKLLNANRFHYCFQLSGIAQNTPYPQQAMSIVQDFERIKRAKVDKAHAERAA
jgi:hypothetical protein